MSKTYTYKDVRYELEETQGFYYCLVYAAGDETALFQTKYFASVESATTAAINFIEDYKAYRKTKEEKSESQLPKFAKEKSEPKEASPEEEERRVRPAQLWSEKKDAQISAPSEESNRSWRSKPLEARKISESTKIWQENNEIRSSVPKVEASVPPRPDALVDKDAPLREKFELKEKKPRIKPLPVILLVGVALLSISIIVGSASGFFENILRGGQTAPVISSTNTPVVEVTPSPFHATTTLINLHALKYTYTNRNLDPTNSNLAPTSTSVGSPTPSA
jgi:hypothetical protein